MFSLSPSRHIVLRGNRGKQGALKHSVCRRLVDTDVVEELQAQCVISIEAQRHAASIEADLMTTRGALKCAEAGRAAAEELAQEMKRQLEESGKYVPGHCKDGLLWHVRKRPSRLPKDCGSCNCQQRRRQVQFWRHCMWQVCLRKRCSRQVMHALQGNGCSSGSSGCIAGYSRGRGSAAGTWRVRAGTCSCCL